jgi:hypothetical protein
LPVVCSSFAGLFVFFFLSFFLVEVHALEWRRRKGLRN